MDVVCPICGCESCYFEPSADDYYCPNCSRYFSDLTDNEEDDEEPMCPECGNLDIEWEGEDDDEGKWYCEKCDKYFSQDEIEYA